MAPADQAGTPAALSDIAAAAQAGQSAASLGPQAAPGAAAGFDPGMLQALAGPQPGAPAPGGAGLGGAGAGNGPGTAVAPPAHPPPATQLAQAASAIHIAPGATGQVTIHLQPAELGSVQIRIERGPDGSATVTVQAERADTLHAIQQDVAHLHQALDRAGLPAEARQLTMQLAPAAPGGAAGGTDHAGTGAEGHRQSPMPRQAQRGVATDNTEDTDQSAPRWIAAGLNITA